VEALGAKSSASRHIEVEKKFDVQPNAVPPSFDGLAAVSRAEKLPTQSLDAIYFDTAGHDLAAQKVTLRRRTGGPDAGWHLKLPAGPDARTEVRAPLETGPHETGGEAPDDLVDIVRAIVRDRPLVRVARISTTRNVHMLYGTDGTQLAEFCDDDVSAWALDPTDGSNGGEQHWHEWELELVDGTRKGGAEILSRLSNRLLDAGGAPAGHGSKLAKVLSAARASAPERPEPPTDPIHRAVAEHVAELLEWDRAVRSDTYDSVHQMRVTTRKIRSLLQATDGALFGLTDDAWVLDELKALAGVLGIARDAEVLAERYEEALDSLAPELIRGPVRERLVEGAKRRYQAGLRRSLTAMRSPRYFRLLDALEALVVTGPAGSASEAVSVDIEDAYKKLRKAARAADDAADLSQQERDEALHRIRKRAKKLRYVAAATGESKVAEEAKAIQSLLGDHQDSVVSRNHLDEQSLAAHSAGEDTFTYGLLYQQEDDVALFCEEELDGVLKRLHKSVHKAHSSP